MKPLSGVFLALVLFARPVSGQPADPGLEPSATSANESPAAIVADASPVDSELTESSTEPSSPAGAENGDTDIEFYHLDALGSVRMVTNRTGAVLARYDYLPFGEDIDSSLSGRNQVPGYGGASIPRRFTAKERDLESGLDYFGTRYYSGPQGRFTSADRSDSPQPIPDPHASDPQSLNLYAYARNSPLINIDADGRGWRAGVVGALITTSIEAYRQVTSGRSLSYPEINARLVIAGGVGFGVGAAAPEIAKSAPGFGVGVARLALLGGGSVAVRKIAEGVVDYIKEVANRRTERLGLGKFIPTVTQIGIGAAATAAGGVVGANLPSEGATHAAEKSFESLGELTIQAEEERQEKKDQEVRHPTPKPTPTPRTTEPYD